MTKMKKTISHETLMLELLKESSTDRRAHLQEAIQCFANGEKGVALELIRHVINASCGFVKLSQVTGVNEKSLMRMFSKSGNPTVQNFMKVFFYLMKREKSSVRIEPEKTMNKISSSAVA